MTESEIEAFLSVVRFGTISAAAQKLFITQPALSRRITSLEEQLGYSLFTRHKGGRTIELTAEGRSFIPLAEKWRALFAESLGLSHAIAAAKTFRFAAVGSMFTYILPPVLRRFLAAFPECHFHVVQHHSSECYEHMEAGNLDLALISDDIFSKTVETVPAFKARFQLVTKTSFTQKKLRPADLDPAQEIRVPWTPEYDAWHDYWFGGTARAHVRLDQMALLEYFLDSCESWAMAPAYIATYLHDKYDLNVYNVASPPADEIIYYLQPKSSPSPYAAEFLQLLKGTLAGYRDMTVLL